MIVDLTPAFEMLKEATVDTIILGTVYIWAYDALKIVKGTPAEEYVINEVRFTTMVLITDVFIKLFQLIAYYLSH